MTKIIFYTHPASPFAHRVNIALRELGLEFEEVILDLGEPREPWFLELNPKGQVPTLKYGDHVLTESLVITRFLTDLKPSHLIPSSGSLDDALTRARMNFFIEAFGSRVMTPFFGSVFAANDEDQVTKTNLFIDAIEKEITPLLKDAAPFFGGSKELTFVEINIAPAVVRLNSFIEPDGAGMLPAFAGERLRSLTTFQAWAGAIAAHKSITDSYDAKVTVPIMRHRVSMMRQQK